MYDNSRAFINYDSRFDPPDEDFDDTESNPTILGLINGLGSTPYGFYRAVYNGTACGPSIGMQFSSGSAWIYCDDLPREDDWEVEWGPVTAIMVGSIVEGCDFDIPSVELSGEFTEENFWKVLEDIDNQADVVWKHFNSVYFSITDPSGDVEYYQWVELDDAPLGTESNVKVIEAAWATMFPPELNMWDHDYDVQKPIKGHKGFFVTQLEIPEFMWS